MPTFPSTDGYIYSFASIEASVGNTIHTITEISYTQTQERGAFRANRPEKLGRTRGDHNVEASCTFAKEVYQELIVELGDGYMDVPFDITINYAEENKPTITDVLVGCLISSEEDGHSQGTDALVVSCDLDVMSMTRNGLKPLKGQL